MRPGVAVLVILLALSVPAAADWGSAFHDRVIRVVGTPTPAGPALMLSDRWAWEIDLDASAFVEVTAFSEPPSAFYLRASCVPGLVAAPSVVARISCGDPGTHTIEVDPAGGVAIDIFVDFRGYTGDRDGGARPFGWRRAAIDDACVVPGVCLP